MVQQKQRSDLCHRAALPSSSHRCTATARCRCRGHSRGTAGTRHRADPASRSYTCNTQRRGEVHFRVWEENWHFNVGYFFLSSLPSTFPFSFFLPFFYSSFPILFHFFFTSFLCPSPVPFVLLSYIFSFLHS